MARSARPALLHALLAAPAFILLSGCDLDELLGHKKPVEVPGSKELAGSWTCRSTGGAGRPAGATVESTLALMRDGTATQVATMRGPINGKSAEMQQMERMTWQRHDKELRFTTTYVVVTGYAIDGHRQDLGEANKHAGYLLEQHPEMRNNATKVVELTANRLTISEQDGARTTCNRKA
jgi:hypothetical protein